MLRRLILIIMFFLLVCGGLWFVLHLNGVDTFGELTAKWLNYDGSRPSNSSVVVNVYELTKEDAAGFKNVFDDELEIFLRRWFVEYNRVLGALSDDAGAFDKLYDRYSPNRAVDALILERLVKARKQCSLPLTFPACDVGLRLVSAVYANEDIIEVRVGECFAAAFDGFPNRVGSYAGTEHFFVLDKSSGSWLVLRHESNSAFARYITGELDKVIAEDGYTREELTSAGVESYVKALKRILEREVYYYPAEPGGAKTADFPYDREKALNYAAAYTDRENVRRNPVFPAYEHNGTNFVSQCLHAGNIPAVSAWEKGKPSWIDANSFYEYATSAAGLTVAGVCGRSDGEAGDVIQFLDGGGGAVQSALISAKYGDEYLITANSEDFSAFPASATGFDIVRIIKVYGYN
ncbi:MAG: amidase domain-containing protein [Oscillospiraceae bacterium]|jgi:hypothetical protein|nr:amidase domain-containing protein [Oscillospiraceae bacterium]